MLAGLRTLLPGVLLLLTSCPGAAAQTALLRLCADPNNLPFSSRNATTPGTYIELVQQIAAALGRPFEPVWTLTYFRQASSRERPCLPEAATASSACRTIPISWAHA